MLLERNYQARYDNPGQPVLQPNAAGRSVIRFDGQGRILMSGPGATPQGEFPFLAAMDVATGQSERLWTSADTDYEAVIGFLDTEGRRVVTQRETRLDPPNLRIRDLTSGQITPITNFPDPAPQLAEATRRLIEAAGENRFVQGGARQFQAPGAEVGDRRDLGDLDLRFRLLLEQPQQPRLARVGERDRGALAARPAHPARPGHRATASGAARRSAGSRAAPEQGRRSPRRTPPRRAPP